MPKLASSKQRRRSGIPEMAVRRDLIRKTGKIGKAASSQLPVHAPVGPPRNMGSTHGTLGIKLLDRGKPLGGGREGLLGIGEGRTRSHGTHVTRGETLGRGCKTLHRKRALEGSSEPVGKRHRVGRVSARRLPERRRPSREGSRARVPTGLVLRLRMGTRVAFSDAAVAQKDTSLSVPLPEGTAETDHLPALPKEDTMVALPAQAPWPRLPDLDAAAPPQQAGSRRRTAPRALRDCGTARTPPGVPEGNAASLGGLADPAPSGGARAGRLGGRASTAGGRLKKLPRPAPRPLRVIRKRSSRASKICSTKVQQGAKAEPAGNCEWQSDQAGLRVEEGNVAKIKRRGARPEASREPENWGGTQFTSCTAPDQRWEKQTAHFELRNSCAVTQGGRESGPPQCHEGGDRDPSFGLAGNGRHAERPRTCTGPVPHSFGPIVQRQTNAAVAEGAVGGVNAGRMEEAGPSMRYSLRLKILPFSERKADRESRRNPGRGLSPVEGSPGRDDPVGASSLAQEREAGGFLGRDRGPGPQAPEGARLRRAGAVSGAVPRVPQGGHSGGEGSPDGHLGSVPCSRVPQTATSLFKETARGPGSPSGRLLGSRVCKRGGLEKHGAPEEGGPPLKSAAQHSRKKAPRAPACSPDEGLNRQPTGEVPTGACSGNQVGGGGGLAVAGQNRQPAGEEGPTPGLNRQHGDESPTGLGSRGPAGGSDGVAEQGNELTRTESLACPRSQIRQQGPKRCGEAVGSVEDLVPGDKPDASLSRQGGLGPVRAGATERPAGDSLEMCRSGQYKMDAFLDGLIPDGQAAHVIAQEGSTDGRDEPRYEKVVVTLKPNPSSGAGQNQESISGTASRDFGAVQIPGVTAGVRESCDAPGKGPGRHGPGIDSRVELGTSAFSGTFCKSGHGDADAKAAGTAAPLGAGQCFTDPQSVIEGSSPPAGPFSFDYVQMRQCIQDAPASERPQVWGTLHRAALLQCLETLSEALAVAPPDVAQGGGLTGHPYPRTARVCYVKPTASCQTGCDLPPLPPTVIRPPILPQSVDAQLREEVEHLLHQEVSAVLLSRPEEGSVKAYLEHPARRPAIAMSNGTAIHPISSLAGVPALLADGCVLCIHYSLTANGSLSAVHLPELDEAISPDLAPAGNIVQNLSLCPAPSITQGSEPQKIPPTHLKSLMGLEPTTVMSIPLNSNHGPGSDCASGFSRTSTSPAEGSPEKVSARAFGQGEGQSRASSNLKALSPNSRLPNLPAHFLPGAGRPRGVSSLAPLHCELVQGREGGPCTAACQLLQTALGATGEAGLSSQPGVPSELAAIRKKLEEEQANARQRFEPLTASDVTLVVQVRRAAGGTGRYKRAARILETQGFLPALREPRPDHVEATPVQPPASCPNDSPLTHAVHLQDQSPATAVQSLGLLPQKQLQITGGVLNLRERDASMTEAPATVAHSVGHAAPQLHPQPVPQCPPNPEPVPQCPPRPPTVSLCAPHPQAVPQCPPHPQPVWWCPPHPPAVPQCPPHPQAVPQCPPHPQAVPQCPPHPQAVPQCPPHPRPVPQCSPDPELAPAGPTQSKAVTTAGALPPSSGGSEEMLRRTCKRISPLPEAGGGARPVPLSGGGNHAGSASSNNEGFCETTVAEPPQGTRDSSCSPGSVGVHEGGMSKKPLAGSSVGAKQWGSQEGWGCDNADGPTPVPTVSPGVPLVSLPATPPPTAPGRPALLAGSPAGMPCGTRYPSFISGSPPLEQGSQLQAQRGDDHRRLSGQETAYDAVVKPGERSERMAEAGGPEPRSNLTGKDSFAVNQSLECDPGSLRGSDAALRLERAKGHEESQAANLQRYEDIPPGQGPEICGDSGAGGAAGTGSTTGDGLAPREGLAGCGARPQGDPAQLTGESGRAEVAPGGDLSMRGEAGGSQEAPVRQGLKRKALEMEEGRTGSPPLQLMTLGCRLDVFVTAETWTRISGRQKSRLAAIAQEVEEHLTGAFAARNHVALREYVKTLLDDARRLPEDPDAYGRACPAHRAATPRPLKAVRAKAVQRPTSQATPQTPQRPHVRQPLPPHTPNRTEPGPPLLGGLSLPNLACLLGPAPTLPDLARLLGPGLALPDLARLLGPAPALPDLARLVGPSPAASVAPLLPLQATQALSRPLFPPAAPFGPSFNMLGLTPVGGTAGNPLGGVSGRPLPQQLPGGATLGNCTASVGSQWPWVLPPLPRLANPWSGQGLALPYMLPVGATSSSSAAVPGPQLPSVVPVAATSSSIAAVARPQVPSVLPVGATLSSTAALPRPQLPRVLPVGATSSSIASMPGPQLPSVLPVGATPSSAGVTSGLQLLPGRATTSSIPDPQRSLLVPSTASHASFKAPPGLPWPSLLPDEATPSMQAHALPNPLPVGATTASWGATPSSIRPHPIPGGVPGLHCAGTGPLLGSGPQLTDCIPQRLQPGCQPQVLLPVGATHRSAVGVPLGGVSALSPAAGLESRVIVPPVLQHGSQAVRPTDSLWGGSQAPARPGGGLVVPLNTGRGAVQETAVQIELQAALLRDLLLRQVLFRQLVEQGAEVTRQASGAMGAPATVPADQRDGMGWKSVQNPEAAVYNMPSPNEGHMQTGGRSTAGVNQGTRSCRMGETFVQFPCRPDFLADFSFRGRIQAEGFSSANGEGSLQKNTEIGKTEGDDKTCLSARRGISTSTAHVACSESSCLTDKAGCTAARGQAQMHERPVQTSQGLLQHQRVPSEVIQLDGPDQATQQEGEDDAELRTKAGPGIDGAWPSGSAASREVSETQRQKRRADNLHFRAENLHFPADNLHLRERGSQQGLEEASKTLAPDQATHAEGFNQAGHEESCEGPTSRQGHDEVALQEGPEEAVRELDLLQAARESTKAFVADGGGHPQEQAAEPKESPTQPAVQKGPGQRDSGTVTWPTALVLAAAAGAALGRKAVSFPWPLYLIDTRDCFSIDLVPLCRQVQRGSGTYTETSFMFPKGQHPPNYFTVMEELTKASWPAAATLVEQEVQHVLNSCLTAVERWAAAAEEDREDYLLPVGITTYQWGLWGRPVAAHRGRCRWGERSRQGRPYLRPLCAVK
eukprot:jgi/Botrbrau1/1085/Bobra.0076s0049.1